MEKVKKIARSLQMAESLVEFLSDRTTLLALGAVAVGTAVYLSSSPTPVKPPVPLNNQSVEIPVRPCYARTPDHHTPLHAAVARVQKDYCNSEGEGGTGLVDFLGRHT